MVSHSNRPQGRMTLPFIELGYFLHSVIVGLGIKRSDNALRPLLSTQGIDAYVDKEDGKLSASLQIAFREYTKCLRLYRGDGWSLGIFQDNSDSGKGMYLTVFMRTLQQQSPHIYFDAKRNNSLFRRTFPVYMDKAQLVWYEGYMSDKFTLYAPVGYGLDALVVGAPDVLDAIDRLHAGADIEILGDQLYYIYPVLMRLENSLMQLIDNSAKLATAIDDNLSRYRDDRSISATQPVGYEGRWLARDEQTDREKPEDY